MSKRLQRYSLFLTVMLLAVTLLPACLSGNSSTKKAKVMLVLANDKDFASYPTFIKEVKATLKEGGYQADIQTLYMDMDKDNSMTRKQVLAFQETMKQKNWKPDVMLFESDGPAWELMEKQKPAYFDFRKTPIVLGGLFDAGHWSNHKNMARWTDPVNFCANIDLAVQLSGVNLVEIELGHNAHDLRMRNQLRYQINRPPYVNNMDFHETRLSEKDRKTIFRDSIMVLVYDTEKPWLNVADTTNLEGGRGHTMLRGISTFAWRYPQVVVKNDEYGDMLASKTNRPQFTAMRSHFGNGHGDYLAGYFASYRTVARDIAGTATQILDGTPPYQIEMKEHKKEYWMDYKAMKRLGMDYQDYQRKYTIIGAPYMIRHSFRFFILLGIATLFILLLIALAIRLSLKIHRKVIQTRILHLEESLYITHLSLQGADCYMLHNAAEIEQYAERALNKELISMKLKRDLKEPGKYTYLLKGDILENKHDEYWEMKIFVQDNLEVNALLMNINEHERQRIQMHNAETFSELSRTKDDFMKKTSVEISGPLNAICRYCERIAHEQLNTATKKELSAKIQKNSETLTTIINDILLFSRIESGRQQYVFKDVKVDQLIYALHAEWSAKALENGMSFLLIPGRPDVYAHVDADRMRDILNQLLSNAFKFTQKGEISFGWRYHLGKKTVELFVEDTGVGISKDKMDQAFSLFWKAHEFIPGVGLGLNIAKQLTENMNGQLVAASKEKIGSRFSVFMPGYATGNLFD